MRAAWTASMIFSRVSNILFQQVEGGLRYPIAFDARHAPVIDGTFALEAGAAFDWFADDASKRTGGAGADFVGCAKYSDRGHSERGSNVHGSRVVGQIDAAGGGHIDKFGKRSFAREVFCGHRTGGFDEGAQLAFSLRSEDGNFAAKIQGNAAGGGGETIGQPLFRGSIGGSGADADDIFAEAESAESREAGEAGGGCAVEADEFAGRKRVENSSSMEQLQIIKTLMRRDFAGFGDGDGSRKQQATAVAGVADAFRNAGGEGDCRGFEGVLQKDRAIEILFAQRGCGTPFRGEIRGDVRNHAMAEGFASIQIGDPGLGEDGDFRGGKFLVQGAQGREGHNSVAHPVGGAHQNLAIGHLLTSVVCGRRTAEIRGNFGDSQLWYEVRARSARKRLIGR